MLPFDTQIATVVRQSNIGTDTTYEPLLRVDFGINDRRSIRRAAHGAGTGADPNPMHYPADNDVCWYIISGKIRLIQARSDGSDRLEAGDFVYIPSGAIHVIANALRRTHWMQRD